MVLPIQILGIDLITLIQSILLIISAIIILIASLGVLNLDKNMPNVVYARIHILGMIDIAGIIAFIALGQPLFALIYLILAPFLAHAMANAYFYGEDDYNTLNARDMPSRSTTAYVEVEDASLDNEGNLGTVDSLDNEENLDTGASSGTDEENLDSGDD